MTAWRTELRDKIGIIYLDVPDSKQNILTVSVLEELDRLLDVVHKDLGSAGAVGLVIASGKEGSFIAGADVNEFDRIDTADLGRFKAAEGQRILSKIARLPMPTVAAINGFCLGGGCELALACTYRVAAIDSKVMIGLPETKLGILPGFGGTQRLPRVVGILPALELMLAGKLLDARGALKAGLVDRIVAPALLMDAAMGILRRPPDKPRRREDFMSRLLGFGPIRNLALKQVLKKTLEKSKGAYPALPALIDVVGRSLAVTPLHRPVSDQGLAIEAEALGKLVITPESRNLRYLFFLMESRKKYAPYTERPRKVARAAVLGAGIMGGGIAWAFSSRRIPVRVKDIKPEPLLGALSAAAKVFQGDVKRRKLAKCDAQNAMALIGVATDYTGFRSADVVVEAVVERMDVKKAVLAELESQVRDNAVIATNTSGLSIDEMASVMKHPERFGGLHFFNPVHRMPLVEIIRGRATDEATVATLFAVAQKLGKTPVLVADAPGFLVNRVLIPYMLEAARMLEEGVAVAALDRVAERFGMPMGPMRLADEVGLDVGLHVARHLAASFGPRMKVPQVLEAMVGKGLLGKKNGKGFYIHAGSNATLNPGVREFLTGGEATIHDNVIEDRLFLVMLIEAIRCLEEGIVATTDDVDTAMINGTGFPPFRGGLIRWARTVGHAGILRRLLPLEEKFGERFATPESMKAMLAE